MKPVDYKLLSLTVVSLMTVTLLVASFVSMRENSTAQDLDDQALPRAFVNGNSLNPTMYVWRTKARLIEHQPQDGKEIEPNRVSNAGESISITISGKLPDEIYVKGFTDTPDQLDDNTKPQFEGECRDLADVCHLSVEHGSDSAEYSVVISKMIDDVSIRTIVIQVFQATFKQEDQAIGLGAYSVSWVLDVQDE